MASIFQKAKNVAKRAAKGDPIAQALVRTAVRGAKAADPKSLGTVAALAVAAVPVATLGTAGAKELLTRIAKSAPVRPEIIKLIAANPATLGSRWGAQMVAKAYGMTGAPLHPVDMMRDAPHELRQATAAARPAFPFLATLGPQGAGVAAAGETLYQVTH